PTKSMSTLSLQPMYNRIEVQCTDPDLKREALSELFDHCMTPITTTFPIIAGGASWCTDNSIDEDGAGCDQQRRRRREACQRQRPLSAAPSLSVDMLSVFADRERSAVVDTGLMSPHSPLAQAVGADECNSYSSSIAAALGSHDEYPFDDGAFDNTDDGSSALSLCTAPGGHLGTFADLRRKLYGGSMHGNDDTVHSLVDGS
ncbi:hypothetical protein H4S06_005416, partial [Coemansia sp. BCRC 34490]